MWIRWIRIRIRNTVIKIGSHNFKKLYVKILVHEHLQIVKSSKEPVEDTMFKMQL
jgi:hypothetical protein